MYEDSYIIIWGVRIRLMSMKYIPEKTKWLLYPSKLKYVWTLQSFEAWWWTIWKDIEDSRRIWQGMSMQLICQEIIFVFLFLLLLTSCALNTLFIRHILLLWILVGAVDWFYEMATPVQYRTHLIRAVLHLKSNLTL